MSLVFVCEVSVALGGGRSEWTIRVISRVKGGGAVLISPAPNLSTPDVDTDGARESAQRSHRKPLNMINTGRNNHSSGSVIHPPFQATVV